jgi:WD40 repeat protein
MALSADGKTLALGDRQVGVLLLNASNGREKARLAPAAAEPEASHVRSLAFSPDGSELAVGLQQGTVEIWSLARLKAPLLRLPGHRGWVNALAYDRDGRYLASGGSDNLVDVWDLERVRSELGRLGLGW